jgi:hypothetical protein
MMQYHVMMETASSSETSVDIYQTTRRNIPEGSYLHTRRRENLISHPVRLISELSSFEEKETLRPWSDAKRKMFLALRWCITASIF